MNARIVAVIAACAGLTFIPELSPAQGVVYLNNTGNTVAGYWAMGRDASAVGAEFQTGSNEGGYAVNTLQLLFGTPTGNPQLTTFTIELCADNSGAPGSVIYYFDPGQNPLAAGLNTFTATPNTLFPNNDGLSANSDYWLLILVTGGQLGPDAYNLSFTTDTAIVSPDGWMNVGNIASSQGGLPMFTLDATAVPEPSSFTLLAMTFMGLLPLAYQRLRRKSL